MPARLTRWNCLMLLSLLLPGCSDDGDVPDKDSTVSDSHRETYRKLPDGSKPPDPICRCKADEICVRFFDGTCKDLGVKCVELPRTCKGNPCVSCPEDVCGSSDGMVWGCDTSTCATDGGVKPEFHYACYGS